MRPRQGGKHTALLMAVLFFAADLAFAQTLGPSTGWQFPPTKVAGVVDVSLDDTGALRITIPPGSAMAGAELWSRERLSGDFDLRITYALTGWEAKRESFQGSRCAFEVKIGSVEDLTGEEPSRLSDYAGADCAITPASMGDRRTPSHGSVVALQSGDDRAAHRTVVQRPPGVPLAAVHHGVADRESLEQFQP